MVVGVGGGGGRERGERVGAASSQQVTFIQLLVCHFTRLCVTTASSATAYGFCLMGAYFS